MHAFRYPYLWLGVSTIGIALLLYLSLATLHLNIGIDNGDKLGHFLAYSVLMGWFVQLFRRWLPIFISAGALIALGVSIEYMQNLTGRSFELADMLANTLGVTLGIFTALTPLRHLLRRFEQRFIARETGA